MNKNTFKTIAKLAILLLIINAPIHAKNISVGPKFGLNLSQFLVSSEVQSNPDTKLQLGFHLGGFFEIEPLKDNKHFSVELDLLFAQRGAKSEFSFGGSTVTSNTRIFYLDIPILVKYSFDVGSVKLIGGIGPYTAIGLSGKSKTEANGTTTKDDLDLGNSATDSFQRLDLGARATFGLELSNLPILFELSYNQGLYNIATKDQQDLSSIKILNQDFGLSFAYRFKI